MCGVRAFAEHEREEACAELAGTWGVTAATELAHRKALEAFAAAYEREEAVASAASELTAARAAHTSAKDELEPIARELRAAKAEDKRRREQKQELADRRRREEERCLPKHELAKRRSGEAVVETARQPHVESPIEVEALS
jgi:hypothetical protein